MHMGNKNSNYQVVNYEYLKSNHILLNVLPETEQNCLIYGTILASDEVLVINRIIDNCPKRFPSVVIYGKNARDYGLVIEKAQKLSNFGFDEIYIYLGGLFEWLLLQDIYGDKMFMTTTKVDDFLVFK